MCDTLVELRAGLSRYAAGFDAAVLSASQASAVIDAATAVERMAGALRAKAAARSAECQTWKHSAARSAASHLAAQTSTTVSAAARSIATAKALEHLPVLDAAARSGALSAEQTAAIADAASADPGAEARLVAEAASHSLAELRAECARTSAVACADGDARRRRVHDRRSLRQWSDAGGEWHLHLTNTPEVGAQVMAALEGYRDRVFSRARAEGRREPVQAYAADALVDAVCRQGEAPARSRAKIVVRVDLPALLRGHTAGGETCEIAGVGPVAVSAVRDLIDTGDPFLAAVVTTGEAVAGVAHLGRRPRAVQRTALEWLYPACAVRGCGATTFLEDDHRLDWANSHLTVVDLLDRLCSHHHDLKTRHGWGLVEGRGTRAFVSPDDPRHPGTRRSGESAHDPPLQPGRTRAP